MQESFISIASVANSYLTSNCPDSRNSRIHLTYIVNDIMVIILIDLSNASEETEQRATQLKVNNMGLITRNESTVVRCMSVSLN